MMLCVVALVVRVRRRRKVGQVLEPLLPKGLIRVAARLYNGVPHPVFSLASAARISFGPRKAETILCTNAVGQLPVEVRLVIAVPTEERPVAPVEKDLIKVNGQPATG